MESHTPHSHHGLQLIWLYLLRVQPHRTAVSHFRCEWREFVAADPFLCFRNTQNLTLSSQVNREYNITNNNNNIQQQRTPTAMTTDNEKKTVKTSRQLWICSYREHLCGTSLTLSFFRLSAWWLTLHFLLSLYTSYSHALYNVCVVSSSSKKNRCQSVSFFVTSNYSRRAIKMEQMFCCTNGRRCTVHASILPHGLGAQQID